MEMTAENLCCLRIACHAEGKAEVRRRERRDGCFSSRKRPRGRGRPSTPQPGTPDSDGDCDVGASGERSDGDTQSAAEDAGPAEAGEENCMGDTVSAEAD